MKTKLVKFVQEVAYSYPGIAVIDNDDFREDTLTSGRTSHHTNMMFVQPVGNLKKR